MTRVGERGSVLVLSLWIVLFLSLFAWGMARRAGLEATLSRQVVDAAEAESLARGKVLDVARSVKESDGGGPTSPQSPWTAGLIEEESRVNLNKADLRELKLLFRNDDLAAAVVDWRDPDDKVTPGGAERGDYGAWAPYSCRNAPFRFPEELLLVKGMTRESYDKALPLLTLWGDGRVNWNTVSVPVLEVLGFSPQDAERIRRFRLGPDGQSATEDDVVASQFMDLLPLVGEDDLLSDKGKTVLSDLLARNRFSFRGTHLRWAGVIQPDEASAPRSMTLVLSPWDAPGKILLWREQ